MEEQRQAVASLNRELRKARHAAAEKDRELKKMRNLVAEFEKSVQSWRDKYQALKAKCGGSAASQSQAVETGKGRRGNQRETGEKPATCYQCAVWKSKTSKLTAVKLALQASEDSMAAELSRLKRKVASGVEVAKGRDAEFRARWTALKKDRDTLQRKLANSERLGQAFRKKYEELVKRKSASRDEGMEERLRKMKPSDLANQASTAILSCMRRQLIECQLALGSKLNTALATSARGTTIAQEITLLKAKMEWLRLTVYKTRSEMAKLCVTLVPSWNEVFGAASFVPMEQSTAYYLLTLRKMINAFRLSINVTLNADGTGGGVSLNMESFRAAVASGFVGDAKARFGELEATLHSTRETQRQCARMLAHVSAVINKRLGTSIPCVIMRSGDEDAASEAAATAAKAGVSLAAAVSADVAGEGEGSEGGGGGGGAEGTKEDPQVRAFSHKSTTVLNDMVLRLVQDLMSALDISVKTADTQLLPASLRRTEKSVHDVDERNKELVLHMSALEAELQVVSGERDLLRQQVFGLTS